MKPPQFIVIGAQKSASSFLQNCLTEHPAVWMPVGETPYFESPDYDNQPPEALTALFDGRPEPMCGIKRPNYIGKPEVPPRITADYPDIKLLAVLRNPADRAISAYFHLIKAGTLPAIPIEQGMAALLDQDPTFLKKHPRAHEILEFGRYHKYLSMYRHFLDHGRLLVLLHEDILRDRLACIQQAYRHLGVDESFVPTNAIDSRPQAIVYQPTRLKLSRLRPRLLYKFNDNHTRIVGRTRNPLKIALAAGLIGFDRTVLAPLLGNPKPAVPDSIRQRLTEYYADDTAKLETLINRDLKQWA